MAPLPLAVRGSALIVVPFVSYGAGKDYYTEYSILSRRTFLAIFASNQCSQCWFRGLLGAYITCQSSNALLTTYSICLLGVAAPYRIPPYDMYSYFLRSMHSTHSLGMNL